MPTRQLTLWDEPSLCLFPGRCNRRPAGLYRLLPNDAPRTRLRELGPAALATSEVLALVIGGKPDEALDTARRLLARFEGLRGLRQAALSEVAAVPGIGPARATAIKAALEVGRRVLEERAGERPIIRSPDDAACLLMPEMADLPQEQLRVLLLDTRHQVVRQVLVYQGNVNTSLVRTSEVYRDAVRENCPAILLAHSHPSGDPTPSPHDVAVTKELVSAGNLLSIELVDHLIIGRDRYVSMRERGLGWSKESGESME